MAALSESKGVYCARNGLWDGEKGLCGGQMDVLHILRSDAPATEVSNFVPKKWCKMNQRVVGR